MHKLIKMGVNELKYKLKKHIFSKIKMPRRRQILLTNDLTVVSFIVVYTIYCF